MPAAATNTLADLLVHSAEGVLTLTLNRIEKKNSITTAMYGALADALDSAARDPAVRVVVIQGHAHIFSAGNDIGDFLAQSAPQRDPSLSAGALPADPVAAFGEAVVRGDLPVYRFLTGIASFPKPLIAAVCGPAVGIGTTMLFHCDLVYAGDNAAFSMPFVNLGLCPEAASSLLVPQMMGYHRAAEALLLGEPFMAEAAMEVGLVNRIVPPTEANAVAQAQAKKLAAKPLASLIETKRLMKKGQSALVLQQLIEEGASFDRLMREPAAQAAFGKFMDKRKPELSPA